MRFYATPIMGLWKREAIVFTRERSRIIASAITPILWLGFVGTGLAASVDAVEVFGYAGSFRDVFFPGILAQAVMFGTLFYGLYIVWDRKMDVLKAVLVAPVPRAAVFVGKVLGGSTEAIIQGVVLLVIGRAFVDYTETNIPFVLGIVVLTAIAFTSLGLALGSFFESFEGFQIVMSFLAFPLFFLSGAFYNVEAVTPWLATMTRLNPLAYSVDALRGLLIGIHYFPYWMDVGVLVGFGLAMIWLGTWSFNRMKQ